MLKREMLQAVMRVPGRRLAVAALAVSSACLWLGLARSVASGAEAPAQGPVAPKVTAVKVDQPPTIDGRVDDACWEVATHAVGFWRLDDGSPEYEPTEAWICYDEQNVYVAWYCHDSRPDTIVAQQKKRGGSLLADDWVGIDLDVDFDQNAPYWFDVSAGGVQLESIPGGAAAKIEWRGDWRAATSRTDDGWQAEIALPLSLFRYPRGQSTFGFVLIRRLAREDDWSVWPSIGPGFELSRQAAWTDLDLPAPVQRPVIMPYALAEFGDQSDEGVTAGLDVKHQFPNGLQGMFCYNPDFRDVEDVVETIDFTYVERYLPEYRPFFLEGSGYHPYQRIFYSRRIADFDTGVKLFGKAGRHSVGALATAEFGEAYDVVMNTGYDITPFRSAGAALVSHRAPGQPANLAYELGSYGRFPKDDGEASYWLSWEGSRTEGAGGDGRHAGLGWNRNRSVGLSWSAGWERTSEDFSPALGYVPEVGRRLAWINANHRRRYEAGPVLERYWFASLDQGEALTGRRWHANLGGFVNRRDQRSLYAEAGAGFRDGFDESTAGVGLEWRNRDIYRSGSVSIAAGERLDNPYRYVSLSQGVRAGENLSLRLRAERVSAGSLDENGRPVAPTAWQQYVATLAYDVTTEKTVSARLVEREAGTNWYLAYRQRVRAGTDAWVIVGDPNTDEFARRVAVKLVRVF